MPMYKKWASSCRDESVGLWITVNRLGTAKSMVLAVENGSNVSFFCYIHFVIGSASYPKVTFSPWHNSVCEECAIPSFWPTSECLWKPVVYEVRSSDHNLLKYVLWLQAHIDTCIDIVAYVPVSSTSKAILICQHVTHRCIAPMLRGTSSNWSFVLSTLMHNLSYKSQTWR